MPGGIVYRCLKKVIKILYQSYIVRSQPCERTYAGYRIYFRIMQTYNINIS